MQFKNLLYAVDYSDLKLTKCLFKYYLKVMDFVKELIIKALPEASMELVSSVLTEMEEHGVENVSHLQYFNPETDLSVLKTIQKRRLKKEIEDTFANSKFNFM